MARRGLRRVGIHEPRYGACNGCDEIANDGEENQQEEEAKQKPKHKLGPACRARPGARSKRQRRTGTATSSYPSWRQWDSRTGWLPNPESKRARLSRNPQKGPGVSIPDIFPALP